MKLSKTLFLFFAIFVYYNFAIKYGYLILFQSSSDFNSYFAAAKLSWQDNLSPYLFDLLSKKAYPFVVTPYVYSPPSLLLFFPFTFFSLKIAKAAWLITSHLIIFAGLLFLVAQALKKNENILYLIFIVFVSFYNPLVVELISAQVNIFVLLMLILFWKCLRNELSPSIGSFALATSIILKTYPIIFLPLLLLLSKWRYLLLTLIFLVFYLTLSYLLLPKEIWQSWYETTVQAASYSSVLPFHPHPSNIYNLNINGYFARLINADNLSRILSYLLALIILAYSSLIVFRNRKDNSNEGIDISFFIFCLLYHLLAVYTWEHHFVILIPACLYILKVNYKIEKDNYKNIFALLMIAIIASSIPYYPLNESTGFVLRLISPIKFYALIGLWIYFVKRLSSIRSLE